MGHAPDSHRIRAFRHWAPVFEVLDHDSVPTSITVLAAGSVVLVGLALAEGRPMRADAAGPTLLAVLALTALGAALVMTAGEALAWMLAIPVGRDVARAAASLESARVAVGRIHAIPAPDDAALVPYIARIDRSAERLRRWLADADAGIVAWANLPDPATRASRLGLLREEGHRIVAAAEALDAVSGLVRWLEMCPWSPLRPDAFERLPRELTAAEHLVTDHI
jgi:hypothetical protein